MLFVLLVRKGSLAFSHNPFPSVFLLVSPCAVPIFQRRASKVSKSRLVSLSKGTARFLTSYHDRCTCPFGTWIKNRLKVKNRLKAASKRGDCCCLPRRRDEAPKSACVRGLSCYRVKKEKFSDHNSLCILETHDCKDKVASRCPRLKEEGYCKSMDPDVRLRMRNMCAMTCNFCRK